MKYCFSAGTGLRHLKDVEEIIIVWHDRTKLTDVIKYCGDHPTQRIILQLTDSTPIAALAKLPPLNNLSLLITREQYPEYEEHVPQIPFFFSEAPQNILQLAQQLDLGATDVYITGALGFECGKIAKMRQRRHFTTRAIVNWARDTQNSLTSFWIRPSDISVYEDTIDVVEFYWKEIAALDPLYELYTGGVRYPQTDLKILIHGLSYGEGPLLDGYISDLFGRRRYNCGNRCLYSDSCHLCYLEADSAQMVNGKLDRLREIVSSGKATEQE